MFLNLKFLRFVCHLSYPILNFTKLAICTKKLHFCYVYDSKKLSVFCSIFLTGRCSRGGTNMILVKVHISAKTGSNIHAVKIFYLKWSFFMIKVHLGKRKNEVTCSWTGKQFSYCHNYPTSRSSHRKINYIEAVMQCLC